MGWMKSNLNYVVKCLVWTFVMAWVILMLWLGVDWTLPTGEQLDKAAWIFVLFALLYIAENNARERQADLLERQNRLIERQAIATERIAAVLEAKSGAGSKN
ncbi:MAG: hypothetical protein LBQ75_02435 [Zoogloeaceae bacterium]|nr:hypothetical protein [Zoogloeaceae bacterium]